MFGFYYIIPCAVIVVLIVIGQLTDSGFFAIQKKMEGRYVDIWEKMVNEHHLLTKKECGWFKRESRLRAFFDLVDKYPNRVNDFASFIEENSEGISQSFIYSKRNTSCAYFVSLIVELQTKTGTFFYGYTTMLLSYLRKKSVFCRENSLKALFQCGDPGLGAKALIELSKTDDVHSEKLLEDILLGFNGNHVALSDALIENFDKLNPSYQVVFVHYLTIENIHKHDEYLRAKIDNSSIDLICSVLRLISKDKTELNKQILLYVIEKYSDKEEDEAAPAFVAATGLGGYAGDDLAMFALTRALVSKHWQLRNNAAKAFMAMKLPQETIDVLLRLADPFARDALSYVVEENQKSCNS
ncbi:MAG: hypothetical protein MJ239_04235 [Bacilli bacterium]|nr:hypothetical protein [Bacilli bacterium]